MSYRVNITATAVKERKKLDATTRIRVDKALQQLLQGAYPPGAKKITGSKNDWCIRVGDYRVLYEVDDQGRIITVWRIAHRREVYR
ncbi:MAG: type II toxin-antitoxin system RelE/ParE family toxin [Anaerolinea sp.]|nr:type II toxin-antitoxin system RelE/ParE family toxin [Anaerolinea sp.]